MTKISPLLTILLGSILTISCQPGTDGAPKNDSDKDAGSPTTEVSSSEGSKASLDSPENADAEASDAEAADAETIEFEPAYPADVSTEGLSSEDVDQQKKEHSHDEGDDHSHDDGSHAHDDGSHSHDDGNHDEEGAHDDPTH